MEILYGSEELERRCTDDRTAKRDLGPAGFKKLRTRLAELEAAARVTELAVGNPHPLVGDREGQFAVNLDGGRRLVFKPVADPVPRKADGGIAWSEVTAVRIVYIGDYHD